MGDDAGIRALVETATGTLQDAGVSSPRGDAEQILAHVLGIRRSTVLFAEPLSSEQEKRFQDAVKRRAAREPLQHIIGVAAFRHVDVAVGPGVFVPRPETETVAGAAIDLARPDSVVVDLCTGSGAIALAVAEEVPGARVYACEVDPGAFVWAERNLTGTRVQLILADAADAFPELDGTVDVVVSNPPYIPLDAYESVEVEVRDHDPAAALWSGRDGLDAIRMIEDRAARLLRPGGYLVLEHAEVQHDSVVQIAARTGRWADVRDNLDLAGRLRFLTARRT